MRINNNKNKVAVTVCLVLMAAGLVAGGQIVIDPRPRPSLAAELEANYRAISNRQENLVIDAGGWNVTWNTNSAAWGYAGLTAFGLWGRTTNALLSPYTAITPRHLYVRGHDTGTTNGQITLTNTGRWECHFLTTNNLWVTNRVIASYRPATGDNLILLMASNLPATIQPMPLANAAFVAKVGNATLTGFCQHFYFGTPGKTSPFTHSMFVSNDSGSPDFYLWRGQMVMTGGRTTTGHDAAMQTAIDYLTTWAGLNPTNYQPTFPNPWRYQ